jgi:hypothetical protein
LNIGTCSKESFYMGYSSQRRSPMKWCIAMFVKYEIDVYLIGRCGSSKKLYDVSRLCVTIDCQ